MQLLRDLFQLFYPDLCVNCSRNLNSGETVLCLFCYRHLPIITGPFYSNQIRASFYGRIEVTNVTAFVLYQKLGMGKTLIHHLKYKNRQDIGTYIGHLLGQQLAQQPEFNSIDYIVPVPLHASKLRNRGYNQLTAFGTILSTYLHATYQPDILKKISNTTTQTLKKRFERFSDHRSKFHLTNLHIFEHKHILLIDDVITTGATMASCCHELFKTKHITVSIVSMAYTEKN